MDRNINRLLLRLVCLACVLCSSNSVYAQFNLQPLMQGETYDDAAEVYHLRRLPRDPLAHTSYEKGKQALEGGNVAEGLETLQLVLDESSDFFFYDGLEINGSLISRIETTIAEHRDDYERLYGVEAQQLLDQALKDSSRDGLQQIVQRFALTNAGATTLRLLAQTAMDQGDRALAARLLERVARHGSVQDAIPPLLQSIILYQNSNQPKSAIALISEFQSQIKASKVTGKAQLERSPQLFLDQLVKTNEQQLPEGDLHEWRTPFGSENHAGQTSFAPVMSVANWSQSTIDQWDFSLLPENLTEQLLSQASQLAETTQDRVRANTERVTFPAATPLIVNDQIIVRGDGTLKAFDLFSGEFLWASSGLIETTFEYLNQASYSPQQGRDPAREEMRELFFAQRDWRDLTMSSMSSDGENVYAISNCQLVGSVKQNLLIQNTTEHPLLPDRRNLLSAYQLSSEGKVLWSIGHASPSFGQLEERNIYFYGAPLVVDEHLYVLGEERGQVQLFELDSASGTVLWSVGLLNPEQDLLISDARRMAGLTPAYGAGLIFCPTGEGVISAIDPVRRSVVWSHQYVTESQSFANRFALMRGMRPQQQSIAETIQEQLNDDRWFDSRCIVSGDYLIVTPPDDQCLLCLNSRTGEEVWKHEQAADQSIYIGAATSETILLISRTVVNALNMSDGTPAWQTPVQIEYPSARGIRMGNQFLQPLVTGEIAVIDILDGRLLTKFPFADNQILGNLVASQGTLVSQTGTTVSGFRSAQAVEEEVATLLAQSAESPKGLAQRGMRRLQQGEIDAGINDLRVSYQQDKQEGVRRVLAWALLNGLKHEFPKYVKISEEIEGYLNGPDQQLSFRRAYAQGLQEMGDLSLSLQHYLDFLAILPPTKESQDISSVWSVNDEFWALARINDLFEQAPDPSLLQSQLYDWLLQLEDEALVLRTLKTLPENWLPQAKRLAVFQSFDNPKALPLEAQSILINLVDKGDAQQQAEALQELVNLALEIKNGDAAEIYLNQFKQPSNFEKTIRSNAAWSEVLAAVPRWPEHVEVDPNPGKLASPERYSIPILGPAHPELRGWNFLLDESGTNVEITDAHGRKLARLPTGIAQVRNSMTMGLTLGRYVSTFGNLAVIVLTDRFLLVDLLSDPKQPRLILKQLLITEQDNPYSSRGFVVPGQRPLAGLRTYVSRTPTDTLSGNVGPLSATILCYGLGSHLIAIDPTTGAELWRRRDLEQGSEIFGDDAFVIVNPAESKRLLVYNALDGKFIVERTIPDGVLPNCLVRRDADWGRYLPIRQIKERMEWKLYDPVLDQIKWETNFEIDTEWCPVNGFDIAFLESNKHVTICNGLTGEKQYEFDLPIDFQPGKLTVLSYEDQFVLIANEKTKLKISIRDLEAATSQLSEPIDGVAVAVDRSTQKVQWTQKLDNLSYLQQQPTQWPILLFVNNHGQDMEVLILQRKTGEVILKDAWFNNQSRLTWGVETQPMSIQLRLSRNIVQLNCTEDLNKPQNAAP